jgi:hypothetical protein
LRGFTLSVALTFLPASGSCPIDASSDRISLHKERSSMYRSVP